MEVSRERIDDTIEVAYLMDLYLPLLSERHQLCLRLYYYEDLGFSEIADQLEISRQAVYDSVTKAVKKLHEIETLLGFRTLRDKLEAGLARIELALDDENMVEAKRELKTIESLFHLASIEE